MSFTCLRPLMAAVLAVASLVTTVGTAGARDRPGTPMDQHLDLCRNVNSHAPRLCGYFSNTAHEDVRFELEATRDGAPFPMNAGTFTCPPDARQVTRIRCFIAGDVYSDHYTTSGPGVKQYDADITYGFETPDVDFQTTYCMHFRARRSSDDVVSEHWSAWACATTPPQPTKPRSPSFSVTYHGSQSVPHSAFAGGQAAQPLPETMQIALAGNDGADEYDLSVTPVSGTGATYADTRHYTNSPPFEYRIDPNVEAVNVRVCGVNFAGTTCATQLQSIAGEGAITLPGRVPTSLHPLPTSTPNVLLPNRGGLKPVAIAADAYMVGTDLPGSDYEHAPITGTAEDCEKRCSADGKCVAWTWVKPGVQAGLAMCWLKNVVPAKAANANTTSGVKRSVPIPIR